MQVLLKEAEYSTYLPERDDRHSTNLKSGFGNSDEIVGGRIISVSP